MKQTTYAIIVFIALFVAAAVIEAFPIVSFIALFIMAWGVWKGQLWEFREEGSDKNDNRSALTSDVVGSMNRHY